MECGYMKTEKELLQELDEIYNKIEVLRKKKIEVMNKLRNKEYED